MALPRPSDGLYDAALRRSYRHGRQCFAVSLLSRPSPSRRRHGRCICSGGGCDEGAVIDETGDLSRTSIYLLLQAAGLLVTAGAVETVAVNLVQPETARG